MSDFEILTIASDSGFQGGSQWLTDFNENELRRWIPQIEELSSVKQESICFVPVSNEIAAICYSTVQPSRTIGLADKVVTKVLPVHRNGLSSYRDNIALFGYHFLSSGLFSRNTKLPDSGSLNTDLFDPLRWAAEYEPSDLMDVTHATQVHDRTVVFLAGNPIKFLAATLAMLEPEQRWSMSFAYGSHLSDRREFRLQICQSRDAKNQKFIASHNIRNFDVLRTEMCAPFQ